MANAFIDPESPNAMEPYYPLRAFVCGRCHLVQLEEFETPTQIFSKYLYFSSFSQSWVRHCERYANRIIRELNLGSSSRVIEIASNDGYLLKFFETVDIPVLGIEPAANIAELAQEDGIPTLVEFFSSELARTIASNGQADLVIANNVLAHVPNLNDFVEGVKIVLAPNGIFTMEFPHLLQLIEHSQWDTIYHEHFSYFSFSTVRQILLSHGLYLYDVEELSTHGGSLRIYGCHGENRERIATKAVQDLLDREDAYGLALMSTYQGFKKNTERDKRQALEFLIRLKESGLRMVGYGAPAKGNTMLNYCGVGRDFLDYTCDISPYKQGKLLPGSHLEILSPEALVADRPDIVLILPWNLRGEVMSQLGEVADWGCRFIARTPSLRFVS